MATFSSSTIAATQPLRSASTSTEESSASESDVSPNKKLSFENCTVEADDYISVEYTRSQVLTW